MGATIRHLLADLIEAALPYLRPAYPEGEDDEEGAEGYGLACPGAEPKRWPSAPDSLADLEAIDDDSEA